MSNENFTAWLERLRSGQDLQGQGKLAQRLPDGQWRFCCLGVACEMAEAAGIVTSREREAELGGVTVRVYSDPDPKEYDFSSEVLPVAVSAWLGLYNSHDDNPVVEEESGERNAVAVLNDRGVTFPEIAGLLAVAFPELAG